MLDLDLQLFAEDEIVEEEVVEELDQEEETQEEGEEARFTQADIDAAVKAREKRLKKKYEALLAAKDEGEDGDETNPEVERLQLEVASLKAGVPADKLDKFMKLVLLSEEEDLEDKVTETLEEFAELFAAPKERRTKVNPKNPKNDIPKVTKEQFKKMSYTERVALSKEDPELYKTLTKERA